MAPNSLCNVFDQIPGILPNFAEIERHEVQRPRRSRSACFIDEGWKRAIHGPCDGDRAIALGCESRRTIPKPRPRLPPSPSRYA